MATATAVKTNNILLINRLPYKRRAGGVALYDEITSLTLSFGANQIVSPESNNTEGTTPNSFWPRMMC